VSAVEGRLLWWYGFWAVLKVSPQENDGIKGVRCCHRRKSFDATRTAVARAPTWPSPDASAPVARIAISEVWQTELWEMGGAYFRRVFAVARLALWLSLRLLAVAATVGHNTSPPFAAAGWEL